MELRVEAGQGYSVPPGCYVGVRVGDVLKQGRYEPQRCYSFPSVERRRNAKIDIYRHVGSCVVAVDPEAKSCHEVAVASTDPSMPEMRLSVSVQSMQAAGGPQQREAKTKMVRNQAKDYLSKYGIEEMLSAAVKALLKAQPENPKEFLCRHISESDAAPASPTKAAPASPKKVGPPAGKPAGPIVLSQGKFEEYYKANVSPNVDAACFNALHMKFPAAAGRLVPKASASDPEMQFLKQKAAEAVTKANEVLDLKTTAVRSIANACKDGTFEAAAKNIQGASSATPGWKMLPSVGTWLAKPPPALPKPDRRPCIMSTAMMVGPEFYSLGLPNLLRII